MMNNRRRPGTRGESRKLLKVAREDCPSFNRFGQHEPPTVRIKNIISQYVGDTGAGIGIEEILKEMIQNADDASATKVQFVLDKRQLPSYRVWDEWRPLQGPALCIYNNATFTKKDIECIQKLGVGSKASDPDKTGQFGIGFNVVYQITDCPSLLSDGKDLCLFDPHLRYVPGATIERPGGYRDLQEDKEFVEQWSDVLRGYLKETIQQQGGTIFRLPFRRQNANSEISSMFYTEYSIKEMERELQTMDFKILIHHCLLFTKNIDNVTASVIEKDGRFHNIVDIKRKLNPNMKSDLQTAASLLSSQLRSMIANKTLLSKLTKTTVTYKLITKDEFNSCEWIVNQTFGFQGDFQKEDTKFLNEFLCMDDSGKKFSPIGGVAARLDTTTNSPSAFCFLQLPIQTGLPAHINGHFAIYSSRRSMWTNTAFGDWNNVLGQQVIVPAYCAFLKSASKASTLRNVQSWYLNLWPDPSKTHDLYYNKIAVGVLKFMLQKKLPLVPVVRSSSLKKDDNKQQLEFCSPNEVIFSHGDRNSLVEKVLGILGHNVCTFIEAASKFTLAKIKGLMFLNHRTAAVCLKQSSAMMSLPQKVCNTHIQTNEMVSVLLKYLMKETKDYRELEGLPLCLTSDGYLRLFKATNPVFLSTDYTDILPNNPEMFLHHAIAHIFDEKKSNINGPVKKLTLFDISRLIHPNDKFVEDIGWVKRIWEFLSLTLDKVNIRGQLYTIQNLPIVPGSDGMFYRICDGNHLVNVSKAKSEIQEVITKMELPSLDASKIETENTSADEITSIANSLVLDASQPEDLLQMLSIHGMKPVTFSQEECETLLFYLQSVASVIRKSKVFIQTVRDLPIFETVEGDFQRVGSSVAAIMDDTIPMRGIGRWMQKSNCTLVVENSAFKELYRILGFLKKNTVLIYIDHIFPHFKEFEEELRMSHLECILDTVLPMISTIETEMSRKMLAAELKSLPFIQHGNDLLCASRFYHPKDELFSLLDHLYELTEEYQDEHWKTLLELAGLNCDPTSKDLIAMAQKISSTMSDDTLKATKFSKLLLEALLKDGRDIALLSKMSEIEFIPTEALDIPEQLLQACPTKVETDKLIKLRGSLHYNGIRKPDVQSMSKRSTKFQNWVLGWSYARILPNWVSIPEEMHEPLGVIGLANTMIVCRHCTNLVQSIDETMDDQTLAYIQKAMIHMYDFLIGCCSCISRNCEDCKEINTLRNKPCVVLNEANVAIKPNKLILNMPSEIESDTLRPYVYSRPHHSHSNYDPLFLRLGAHKFPKPDTFAKVLHDIRTDCGSHVMQNNQKQAASSAVHGLMVSLILNPSKKVNFRPLFLPNDKAVMKPAEELIVRDNEVLAQKYKKTDIDYLCKLTSCNLYRHPKEYTMMLTSDIRPLMLSEILHEDFAVTEECIHGNKCEFINEYNDQLQSENFINALEKMVFVPTHLQEELKENLQRLKNSTITCFETLTCHLLVRGRLVESVESSKQVYSDNSNQNLRIFLKHCDEYPGAADSVIGIANVVRSLIFDSVDSGKIEKLLRCTNEDKINEMLIEEDMLVNHLDESDLMTGPRLGEPIPDDEIHLFNADPDVRLVPKEFIGYLIGHAADKPDSQPVIVYAQIVHENRKNFVTTSKSHLFREYTIDIGLGYHITANTLSLYQESENVISSDENEIHTNHAHEQQEGSIISSNKKSISKMLEAIFSVTSGVPLREKLVGRLNKKLNISRFDSHIANTLTEHLKEETKRLEEMYSHIVQQFVKEKKDAAGLVDGDRIIARNWYSKARNDLNATNNLFKHEEGYTWICALSYEAVRKALISCILAQDHQTFEDIPRIRSLNSLMRYIFPCRNYPRILPQLVDHVSKLEVNYIDDFDPRSYKYKQTKQVYTIELAEEAVYSAQNLLDCVGDYLQYDSSSGHDNNMMDKN